MLNFYSGNVRMANTERAVKECFSNAFGDNAPEDLKVIIVYSTLGHKLDKVSEIIKNDHPEVTVVGASCGGVVGSEGVGESMNDIGILAISGPDNEIATAYIGGVTFENTESKMAELSKSLNVEPAKTAGVITTIPGLDCAMDGVVNGFSQVFPDSTHLTGGVSSDNMKGVVSYQSYDETVGENIIWAVALADPTLGCVSRATHGFDAIGDSLDITKTDGLKIVEFDNKPAAEVYASLYKTVEGEIATDMMPFGAMGEKLPEEYWKEYGSEYRLNGLVKAEGTSLLYRTHFNEGSELRLAVRNEKKMFTEMNRVIDEMKDSIDGEILAVSHSDCIARGRFSLNEIKKEEIINVMQEGLAKDGAVPAWLGMYGFGEFCQLGGKNNHHTFTTSLTAIYRKTI